MKGEVLRTAYATLVLKGWDNMLSGAYPDAKEKLHSVLERAPEVEALEAYRGVLENSYDPYLRRECRRAIIERLGGADSLREGRLKAFASVLNSSDTDPEARIAATPLLVAVVGRQPDNTAAARAALDLLDHVPHNSHDSAFSEFRAAAITMLGYIAETPAAASPDSCRDAAGMSPLTSRDAEHIQLVCEMALRRAQPQPQRPASVSCSASSTPDLGNDS